MCIRDSLRFDCHASNVARACNYHTRALRHVRSLLSDEVTQLRAVSLLRDSITARNCLSHLVGQQTAHVTEGAGVVVTRTRNIGGVAVESEVRVDGDAERLTRSETANRLPATSIVWMLAAAGSESHSWVKCCFACCSVLCRLFHRQNYSVTEIDSCDFSM